MGKQANERKEIEDLEELLNQLPSDKVRYGLVFSLVTERKSKRKHVPMNILEDAIAYYAGEQSYEAKEIAKTLKIPGKAIEILEKVAEKQKSTKSKRNNYEYTLQMAAEIAKDALMFDKAVALYDKAGQFGTSGKILYENRKFEEAIKCFIRSKDYETIASIYEELGNQEKAKEFYKKAVEYHEHADRYNSFELAMKSAEKIGWTEKIRELNLKKIRDIIKRGDYYGAGEKAEEIGEYELAVENYLECDNRSYGFKNAWRASKKGRRVTQYLTTCKGIMRCINDKNGDFYRGFGDDDIYEVARKEGPIDDITPFIIEIYEKNYGFHKAAKIAKKAGLNDEANRLYKKAIEREKNFSPFEAAEIAKEAGFDDMAKELYAKAAIKYEREGRFGWAKAAAVKAGLEDKVKLYESIIKLYKK